MKIVKEIENIEYNSTSTGYLLKWGLGEDGRLYQTMYHPKTKREVGYWELWEHKFQYSLSLKEMKHIVKEFGHLVVFT